MSIELMKQALDALEHEAQKGNDDAYRVERDALRAAIEQAQEPVCDKDPQGCWSVRCQLGKICKHTVPRQWQGLTADEIWACNVAPAGHSVTYHISMANQNVLDFAEAIEAKLKEKNT